MSDRPNRTYRALRRCLVLFLAQVFGQYRHTIHDFNRSYHVYGWRGRDYHVDGGSEGDIAVDAIITELSAARAKEDR